MRDLEPSEVFTKRSDWIAPFAILAFLFLIGRTPRASEPTPADWVKSAREYEASGQFAKALEFSDKLLELFPRNHVYLGQAAHLNHELERFDDEAALLERYLLVAPDPGEACMDLPRAYWKVGQSAKMIDAAERCHALEPRNSDFAFSRAIALERGSRMEDALKAYGDGMAKYSSYTDFFVGHSRVLMRLGRLDESWAEIQAVLKDHATNGDALEVQELLRKRGKGKSK